jgi:hypothetical protein
MRSVLSTIVLSALLLSSCSKDTTSVSGSQVFVKYTGESQSIIIEEVYADWSNSKVSILAEGFDHEQLKICLTDVRNTGNVANISEQNISFSDGLDFESTKLEDGYITIDDRNGQEVEGTFKVLLLDDVNGIERRWIEGSFKIVNERYQD